MEEWLGIYVMQAWAMVNHQSIRIWLHQNEQANSQELYLVTSSVEPNAPNSFIDILHTWNGTHFERMQVNTIISHESNAIPSPEATSEK